MKTLDTSIDCSLTVGGPGTFVAWVYSTEAKTTHSWDELSKVLWFSMSTYTYTGVVICNLTNTLTVFSNFSVNLPY